MNVLEGKQPRHNLTSCPDIYPESLWRTKKNREINWTEVQDLNPGLPEYERGLKVTLPRISASVFAVRIVIFKQAFGFLSREFLLLFDSRRKRIFLYLKETNWAEAVSVALRDVNWDVGVLFCCGINAINQQFFYTKEVGYWIIILNIKVEEITFLVTGTTTVAGWQHGSCIFFGINRALFRVSVTFVLSKKYVSLKTLSQSTKVWF